MASACVNNVNLPLCFTRDSDSDFIDFDFEFHSLTEEPLAMLPADELFSDGKLLPLRLSHIKSATREMADPIPKPARKVDPIICIGSGPDSSPKAPTCTSRWRELLRLKRQQQRAPKTDPGSKTPNPNRSLKQILLNPNPLSISSRLSLPSDELSRLSLDKTTPNQPKVRRSSAARCSLVDSPRMNASGKVVFQGLGRSASSPSTFNGGSRGVRAHHHHGHGHGGGHRGMPRSYSANVRVAPVLNVGVGGSLRGGGSVFGFGQLFSGSGSGPKPKN